MKYRAPEGVTALFCARRNASLRTKPVLSKPRKIWPSELGAHGCAVIRGRRAADRKAASEVAARAAAVRAPKRRIDMAQGDLLSLAQLKAHLGVQSNGDDVLLSSLISQISRAIASYLNRPFIWPRDVVDMFDGNGRDRRSSCGIGRWSRSPLVSDRRADRSTGARRRKRGLECRTTDDEPPGAMQR